MQFLCWWLTGLPGAGKTTLAQLLAGALRHEGRAVCVLDGDEVRQGLCHDLDFSPTARHENMRRVAQMARILNRNEIHVVVAMVSPTSAGRAAAAQIIGPAQFLEVHVATPLAVCQQRDPKGLYARAKAGQAISLTGVQAGYEVPAAPALRLDTSRLEPLQALAQLMALAPWRCATPGPAQISETPSSDTDAGRAAES